MEDGEGTFWLCLFDPEGLRYDELYCARGEDGRLRAPGAAARVERMSQDGAPIEWALEQRVNVVTVARSRRE